jgi:hypothetical protein
MGIWAEAHGNKSYLDSEQHCDTLNPKIQEDEATKRARQIILLRAGYYSLVQKQFCDCSDTFPPFSQLATLRGANKRLDSASNDSAVQDVAAWLVKAVDGWRIRCQLNLNNLLPIPERDAVGKPLAYQRATAVWRREDSGPLWYPRLALGSPYHIKDGFIPLDGDGLRHDATAASLVVVLARLVGKEPASVLQDELDIMPHRFLCRLCPSEVTPSVFDWRQAVSP